ncbi:hypothetical protein LSTR_LSTR016327 [Laodelphax striatellus]|uniref:Uncharacterized protein n=1 Tax=Laodelphax striatellus TaxID=195883 RepID=A0A482XP53_LAOST|nr:hypothetical protein LSTR_LSTR016327 [Laodelphax striatellus]
MAGPVRGRVEVERHVGAARAEADSRDLLPVRAQSERESLAAQPPDFVSPGDDRKTAEPAWPCSSSYK